MTDAGAAALGRSPALADVDLCGTTVTAAGVEALAAGCGPRLVRVKLTGVRLTDAGVGRIARAAPHLRELDLYRCTGLTDASVPAIEGLADLRRFHGGEFAITRKGYERLAARLPGCDDFGVLAVLARE